MIEPVAFGAAFLGLVLTVGAFDLLFAFLFRLPRATGGGSDD